MPHPKRELRRFRLAVVLALALAAGAADAEESPPAGIAQEFFAYHFKHDMGFDKKAVANRAKWLTADLLKLCHEYFARPSSPDEVPPIDGDPFTDSQEYPNKFSVGEPKIDGDQARVPVTFSWPESTPARAVTLVLVRGRGAWRIDDVSYESGPTLRALLVEKPLVQTSD